MLKLPNFRSQCNKWNIKGLGLVVELRERRLEAGG